MKSKKIYLEYLFCDNGPDANRRPEVIKGILKESLAYGKDPDAEYIPLRPFKKKEAKEVIRKRGDGFD